MFTFKCVKDSGWEYVYECDSYVLEPEDGRATTINLYCGPDIVSLHLSRHSAGHYQKVTVTNSHGAIIDRFSAPLEEISQKSA